MSAARIPRSLKAALGALALAGLLGVVALAARGGHPDGRGQLHQRQVPAEIANDLLTIIILAYVFVVLSVLVGLYSLRDRWEPPQRRRWWRQLLLLGFVLGAFALFGYRGLLDGDLGRWIRRQQQQAQQAQKNEGKRKPATLPERPAAKRPAEFDWVLAGAIGGGVVLAAALLLARRRSALEVEPEASLEDELSEVVSNAIDDLRAEADARRAVIAAYARMELVLAQHGHPRKRSEAPFEYLGRILVALRVRAVAVRDLTELFERAKFSTHEIDEPMRERAIAALVSVRDDLGATAAAA